MMVLVIAYISVDLRSFFVSSLSCLRCCWGWSDPSRRRRQVHPCLISLYSEGLLLLDGLFFGLILFLYFPRELQQVICTSF